jgi:predicted AAA+ superfamily ATPase
MENTTSRYLSKFIEEDLSLHSLKSLTEDLNVSHRIVECWITILENLYLCFRIPSYGNELKDGPVLPFPKLCKEL